MSISKISLVSCLMLLGCIHALACCGDETPQGTLIEVTSKEELVLLASTHNWSSNSIFLLIPHASNVPEQGVGVGGNYSAIPPRGKSLPECECGKQYLDAPRGVCPGCKEGRCPYECGSLACWTDYHGKWVENECHIW
jgi:hypothetical protein